MLVGPIAPFHENSIYYSAIRPRPDPEVDRNLPHITIEMPVYKESLKETITPSIFSIKKAMQTYARQGGSSSILIHDDGLQLLSESDRLARTAFYSDHNIGYVARPPHDSSEGGFKRAGRFKKASNMNYGLALSLKLETQLARLESGEVDPTTATGDSLEDKALQLALDEVYEESGRRFRPWADNARALRIGEIILIVDSDTIVPEDCLRDAAREMAHCPEVAIIQHESAVLQVAHHYLENGLAYFTRHGNRANSIVCANGNVGPFVGHNAFLRWSAVQDAAFIDSADGVKKIWSESHVSEDLDMALRLQLQGYTIRSATYSTGGFKEGVSLTPYDELNKWEKYSYGVAEIVFHPLKDWWYMGPITKQFRAFIWSPVPVHYKISMLAYMSSYFGVASGFVLVAVQLFFASSSDTGGSASANSLDALLVGVRALAGLGSLSFAVLEYRLGERGLMEALFEMLKWMPFLSVLLRHAALYLLTILLASCFSAASAFTY
jgi:hypothetical protein